MAAVALMIAGCANNDIIEPQDGVLVLEPEKKVLNITASFETPAETRAILEENGATLVKNIQFKWETTDVIQFCFEQDGTRVTNTTNVTGVSADGRTAQFSITVPQPAIDVAQPYKLYAYRSSRKSEITAGSELIANSTIAVLPVQQYSYQPNLADQAIVFSIWSEKDVPANSGSNIALPFKHLGSMMTLNLKNTGATAITDLHSLVLQANPQVNWMYNRFEGGGGAQFDMSTGTFVPGQEQYSFTLTFLAPSQTINPGQAITYYAWFVPNPAITSMTWQLVSLKPPGATQSDITGLSNPNKTINQSLVVGKNYVLFANISVNPSPSPPQPYILNYTTSSAF